MIRIFCTMLSFLTFSSLADTRVYEYQTMVTPKKSTVGKGVNKAQPMAPALKNFSAIHNGHLHTFGLSNKAKNDIKFFERHYWQVVTSDKLFIREKASITEVWSLGKGGVSLINILKKHKVGIEYFPSDFVSLNKKVQWKEVTSLLPLSFITKENQRDTLKFWDHDAIVYEAGNRDIIFTITWLPKLNMPAKIIESTAQYDVETILLNSYTSREISLNDWINTHTNEVYDFADIGDNENDPLLRKIMDTSAYLGNAHRH